MKFLLLFLTLSFICSCASIVEEADYSKYLNEDEKCYVIVEYEIMKNGRTKDHRIVESIPPGLCDSDAIKQAKGWRYTSQESVSQSIRTRVGFKE
ncbi:energy transducer TonB [Microbulbifer sp. VTAC004]|uniref:energy transducer TonB n=1 Tax=Microbulbifer sp. VTAC004 TaxID=3243386 RepID=UPI00403A63E7